MPLRNRRVLVVEDDNSQAAFLTRHLSREGMHCAHAHTMADALERDAREYFDCIILDIGLKDSDPHDYASVEASIRQFRAQIVVYTGHTDGALLKAVRGTGAAIAYKPGVEVLVSEVWAQINFKGADSDSEAGQREAQRRLMVVPKDRLGDLVKWSALLLFSFGIIGWLFHSIVYEVSKRESDRQHFAILDKGMDELKQHDVRLAAVERQNTVSIDDRAALHAQVAAIVETQKELKKDLTEWLGRIEVKIDRLNK